MHSRNTVYPKKYAHGYCFAVLCCGYTLTDFPISIRLTSLALWQSNDCPSASKATLMNMDKYFMWIHYERLHNHNKAKHNKTVCIFLGIYCNYEEQCIANHVLTWIQSRNISHPLSLRRWHVYSSVTTFSKLYISYANNHLHIFSPVILKKIYTQQIVARLSVDSCGQSRLQAFHLPSSWSMMTSSNWNIFRVTSLFAGIPRTRASEAELWCFLWSASE